MWDSFSALDVRFLPDSRLLPTLQPAYFPTTLSYSNPLSPIAYRLLNLDGQFGLLVTTFRNQSATKHNGTGNPQSPCKTFFGSFLNCVVGVWSLATRT